jgi:hypothetical protein
MSRNFEGNADHKTFHINRIKWENCVCYLHFNMYLITKLIVIFLFLSALSPYVRSAMWVSIVCFIYGSDFNYHCRKNYLHLVKCLNVYLVYRKICNVKPVATVISVYIVLCLRQLLLSAKCDLM